MRAEIETKIKFTDIQGNESHFGLALLLTNVDGQECLRNETKLTAFNEAIRYRLVMLGLCGDEEFRDILLKLEATRKLPLIQSELAHYSATPFKAACGADEPNQRTTGNAENVTCGTCRKYLGLAGNL
jgi:hypothetical protein